MGGVLRFLLAVLLPAPGVLVGSLGAGVLPGTAIVSDLNALSAIERRELAVRRAAIEVRAGEIGRQVPPPCANLRVLVQDALKTVDRVGAVDLGTALLTSNPPKFRVTFVVALSTGRLVQDEMIVAVPFEARIVPLGDDPAEGRTDACRRDRRPR